MQDPLDLSGQVALVTGGTRGIGKGITDALRLAGATVVTCARHDADDPGFVACNVRDPDEVAALFDRIDADHGRIDLVVNNAGGSPPADSATASPRFHAAIIDLNLTAPFVVAQHANRRMQAQGGGAIVNIASVSATRPSPGTAAYGAAKAGLVSLTRSLAVEWAPKVRVNALVVGLVRTEQAEQHYGDEAGIARVAATVPLGRLALPADVAGAVLWLASPLAAYVSGAAIEIHGGGERPAFLGA